MAEAVRHPVAHAYDEGWRGWLALTVGVVLTVGVSLIVGGPEFTGWPALTEPNMAP